MRGVIKPSLFFISAVSDALLSIRLPTVKRSRGDLRWGSEHSLPELTRVELNRGQLHYSKSGRHARRRGGGWGRARGRVWWVAVVWEKCVCVYQLHGAVDERNSQRRGLQVHGDIVARAKRDAVARVAGLHQAAETAQARRSNTEEEGTRGRLISEAPVKRSH